MDRLYTSVIGKCMNDTISHKSIVLETKQLLFKHIYIAFINLCFMS